MKFFRVNPPEFTTDMMMDPENQISVNHSNELDVRTGLSACESREELAQYLAQAGIEFRDDWTLVEFEGTYATEEDSDAHLGAVLTHPTRIVATETAGDAFIMEILAAYDLIAA